MKNHLRFEITIPVPPSLSRIVKVYIAQAGLAWRGSDGYDLVVRISKASPARPLRSCGGADLGPQSE